MFSPAPKILRRSIAATVFPAFLFASGSAAALGLGDLVVHSRLGQVLRAEIRLIETPGQGNVGETCFRLGEAVGNEDLPALTQGRLHVEQAGGQTRLLIASLQAINEPALQINVRVGCGAELVRSYTVLIDPGDSGKPQPAQVDRAHDPFSDRDTSSHSPRPPPPAVPADDAYPTVWEAVEGESAKSITQALYPRQPRAQRRFLNALREANPQVDFGEKGEQPLDAGVSLVIPDTRRAPVVRKTSKSAERRSSPPAQKPVELTTPAVTERLSDRLMISGDVAATNEPGGTGDISDLSLRFSSDLSIALSDKVSENTRAMLRVEYKLLNALIFQAEKQLELAEQLRNLEARFAEMRAVNESVAGSVGPQPPVAAEALGEKAPGDGAQPVEVAEPVKEVRPKEAATWWQPMLMLLAVSGLLAWWLARRSRSRKNAAVAQTDLDTPEALAVSGTVVANAAPTPIDPWDAAEGRVTAMSPAPRPDIPPEVSVPLPFHDDDARTAPPASAIEVSHVEEADDSGTVLELAEIMVSFGRVKGACQALAEYLESNPDASLLPWLKLLEIYRMNDMRDEFVACAASLRSHFNVAPASWDEAGACLGEKIEPLNENALSIEDILQKLPTVGTFSHIREGIVKTWGTNEGLAYLKHLLRDTRNGQRSGFPLSIAREILFLLDLLETRLNSKV